MAFSSRRRRWQRHCGISFSRAHARSANYNAPRAEISSGKGYALVRRLIMILDADANSYILMARLDGKWVSRRFRAFRRRCDFRTARVRRKILFTKSNCSMGFDRAKYLKELFSERSREQFQSSTCTVSDYCTLHWERLLKINNSLELLQAFYSITRKKCSESNCRKIQDYSHVDKET